MAAPRRLRRAAAGLCAAAPAGGICAQQARAHQLPLAFTPLGAARDAATRSGVLTGSSSRLLSSSFARRCSLSACCWGGEQKVTASKSQSPGKYERVGTWRLRTMRCSVSHFTFSFSKRIASERSIVQPCLSVRARTAAAQSLRGLSYAFCIHSCNPKLCPSKSVPAATKMRKAMICTITVHNILIAPVSM